MATRNTIQRLWQQPVAPQNKAPSPRIPTEATIRAKAEATARAPGLPTSKGADRG